MKSDVEENAGKVCIRCGEANEPGASRCEKCGAPLDDFASSAPWEMGTVKGDAYHAVDPKKKPIIFWGVWLYFGPSVLVAIWMVWDFLNSRRNGELVDWEMGGVGLWVLVLPALYGLVSLWILCSVTRRYLRK